MDVSIRHATREHLKGVHELVLEWGYTASESETLQWLDALLASPNHEVFVAVTNDSVAGWAVAEKRISLGEGELAEITGLVVSSSFRRSGIGALLVQALEGWSQDLGLSRVVVRSNVSRLESHEFYPALGFELTKTTHVYVKKLKGPDESLDALF